MIHITILLKNLYHCNKILSQERCAAAQSQSKQFVVHCLSKLFNLLKRHFILAVSNSFPIITERASSITNRRRLENHINRQTIFFSYYIFHKLKILY